MEGLVELIGDLAGGKITEGKAKYHFRVDIPPSIKTMANHMINDAGLEGTVGQYMNDANIHLLADVFFPGEMEPQGLPLPGAVADLTMYPGEEEYEPLHSEVLKASKKKVREIFKEPLNPGAGEWFPNVGE